MSLSSVKLQLEKNFMQHYLERFEEISFSVEMPDGTTFSIGKNTPLFHVVLHKEIPPTALLKSTSLALGEAYMNGDLEIKGDLFSALDVFLGQMNQFSTDHKALKGILHPSNSLKKQKEMIHYHYDIGNDFYRLWLDDTMSYSCGYFPTETTSLYEAQMNKIHHILKKLQLSPEMTLLDIGCGWGYLLLEAAKKYKIHGLGITLSEEQAKKFQQRIQEEHLEDYLHVRIMDYRELEKSDLIFDRVVSVGMLEHVGRENYELFLKNVSSVLKPEGVFLLHYISSLQESSGDPWIKKYIFPGGVIPSLREILQLCGDYHFYTLDVESLRRHYTKTLLCWNDNFQKNRKAVVDMFDERFARMWELYLTSCAASFHNGVVDLHQLVLTKGVNNQLPMTRENLYQH